jgi:hypothetical protein
MNPRSTLIPVLLAAVPSLGFASATQSGPAAPVVPICVQSGAADRPSVPIALGAAERGELQRASESSSRLEGLRGGEVSDHDLSVALLAVGVVLIVLLI